MAAGDESADPETVDLPNALLSCRPSRRGGRPTTPRPIGDELLHEVFAATAST